MGDNVLKMNPSINKEKAIFFPSTFLMSLLSILYTKGNNVKEK